MTTLRDDVVDFEALTDYCKKHGKAFLAVGVDEVKALAPELNDEQAKDIAWLALDDFYMSPNGWNYAVKNLADDVLAQAKDDAA
jgi:hypothetical protein